MMGGGYAPRALPGTRSRPFLPFWRLTRAHEVFASYIHASAVKRAVDGAFFG